MNIISKLSFWIKKPEKQTMNSSDGFEQVIMDALAKFKRDGYVKKLKTSITSVPSDNQDLLVFLYNQIASIQANGMCSIQNLHDLLNAIKVYCNVHHPNSQKSFTSACPYAYPFCCTIILKYSPWFHSLLFCLKPHPRPFLPMKTVHALLTCTCNSPSVEADIIVQGCKHL